MEQEHNSAEALALQEQMIALVRAFGLHRPEQTPCGQPIGVAEAHTLLELAQTEPLSQTELASRLRLEKSTVSRLVQILQQRGWIERTRNNVDRRALDLRLTDSGKHVATELAETRHATFTRILAALPKDRQALVLEGLRLLVAAIHDQG